jgi:hypothetical protein
MDIREVDHLLDLWEERLEESVHCLTVAPKVQANWEDNLEALNAIHLLWKIKTKYLGHDGSMAHEPHKGEMHPHTTVYR